MKTWCPHPAYRLLAAKIVLVLVTAFGYLASGLDQPRALGHDTPVFCLASQSDDADEPQSAPRTSKMFSIDVTVTAYSSTPGQTDSTPFITASNTRVREGIIAVSRDLLLRFTPGAPLHYGDLVELEGVGVFRVEDTMNPRYKKRVDIWFPDFRSARNWGVRRAVLTKLLDSHPGRVPGQDSGAPAFTSAATE